MRAELREHLAERALTKGPFGDGHCKQNKPDQNVTGHWVVFVLSREGFLWFHLILPFEL